MPGLRSTAASSFAALSTKSVRPSLSRVIVTRNVCWFDRLRSRLSGGPDLIADEPVEPGTVTDRFHFPADQAARSAARLELPYAAAVRPKNQAVRPLFEAAPQVHVGVQLHAGPFQ